MKEKYIIGCFFSLIYNLQFKGPALDSILLGYFGANDVINSLINYEYLF